MKDQRPTHILYLEDDPGLARLLQRRLQDLDYRVDISSDGREGLARAESGNYDLLIVDYQLPGCNGLAVIRELNSRELPPPAIMLTGAGDEKLAVSALKSGASDYVVKDLEGGYLELIPAVIERALRQAQLAREKRQAEIELSYRMRYENIISALSGHFINLPLDKIDSGIDQALQAVGEFTRLQRCYIFLFDEQKHLINTVYEWQARDLPTNGAAPRPLTFSEFPWIMEKLHRLERIHVPRIGDLPEDATSEKVYFGSRSARSFFMVPLVYRGLAIGALGGDAVLRACTWTDDTFVLMKIVGELLVNTMERKRGDEARRRAEIMRTVQGLAGAISHEFSQPLQVLTNTLFILQRNQNPERFLADINTCHEMVERIWELVEDLKNIIELKRQEYFTADILDIRASARRNAAQNSHPESQLDINQKTGSGTASESA